MGAALAKQAEDGEEEEIDVVQDLDDDDQNDDTKWTSRNQKKQQQQQQQQQQQTQQTQQQLTQTQVQAVQEKLRLAEMRLRSLRRSIQSAKQCEVYNSETGVAEAKAPPFIALGVVTLRLIQVEGLERTGRRGVDRTLRAVVSIRDRERYANGSPPYEGDVAPAPQTSRTGRPETKRYGSAANATKKCVVVFNQEFIFAPVKSGKAEVVIRFVDVATKKKQGQVVQRLAELADQRTRKIMAPIQVPEGSGIDAGTVNVAHLQMQWSHSKLKPLEDDLCRVFGERSELEADLARLKQQEQRSGGSSKQERSNSQRNHGGALRQI